MDFITLMANYLPWVVAIEGLLAGVAMLCVGRYGSATYWLAAFAITVGVTMIPKWG